MEEILQVTDLKISFSAPEGRLQALRGVNLTLQKGETLALVGESGSGKSVTAKAVMGLLPGNAAVTAGTILYDGRNLLALPEREMQKIRGGRIAMIFQDPLSSLDPTMTVGRQISEVLRLKGMDRKSARLQALLPLVQGHPLQVWGEYWALKARLDDASPSEVRAFLQRWAGTYQEDRLRADWLLLAGKRSDWDEFAAHYPHFRMRDDANLRCWDIVRLLDAGSAPTGDAIAQFQRDWNAQRKESTACSTAASRPTDTVPITTRDSDNRRMHPVIARQLSSC